MIATTSQNGAGQARADENARAVEAGLAMHLRVKAELEDARREIAALRQQLTEAAVENESLRSFNNLLESRVNGSVAERDLAIGQRASYEALFAMLQATMREFQVPAVPLIRQRDTGAKPLESGE